MTEKQRYSMLQIPFGWYVVDYSNELNPGDVKAVRYFAQDQVLFRTESGEVSMLDAYCPHLGAHLGYGGIINGECIECPFHAWRWKTDGKIGEIPYAKNIPPKAKETKIFTYPTVEKNKARLRLTITPKHNIEDIHELIYALKEIISPKDNLISIRKQFDYSI